MTNHCLRCAKQVQSKKICIAIYEQLSHRQETSRRTGVIKSREAWRVEMAKWVEAEREDSDADSDVGLTNVQARPQRAPKWLPRSLDLLFAGRKEVDAEVQQQQNRRQAAYTEEARLMELLADEEADEAAVPDDGELEGSGDDFYG